MKTLLAFTLATVYGLLLRFCFAFYAGIFEIISMTMIAVAPMAVGYLTVALSGMKTVTNGWTAFFRPWLTSLVLLVIMVALNIEGLICWVLIYPMFAVMAGFGGLIAYWVMRGPERNASGGDQDKDILDDFDRKNKLRSSLILLMPLVFGAVEQDRLLTPDRYRVGTSIDIPAPPARVWEAVAAVDHIDAEEHHSFFTDLFGLPRHMRTELDTLAVGGRRTAYYERGLYFRETIAVCRPAEQLVVDIIADPGNIPPTVLDDHLVIGGRYFKALKDTYTLTPLPGGGCRLELSGEVEINTPFNGYAALWARWMMHDAFRDLLHIIRNRTMTNTK